MSQPPGEAVAATVCQGRAAQHMWRKPPVPPLGADEFHTVTEP
jgi:hypothetical protein